LMRNVTSGKIALKSRNRRYWHPRSICGNSYGWFEAAQLEF
jgi:hypothetical protein